MTTQPQKKKKRFIHRLAKISLRSLLLVVLVIGAFFGWMGNKRRVSQSRKEALEKLNEIKNSKSWWKHTSADTTHLPTVEGRLPMSRTNDTGILDFYEPKSNVLPYKYLEKLTGPECFATVRYFDLSHLFLDDDDLKFVLRFPELKSLNLDNTAVSDKGVSRLKQLKSLKNLCLGQTAISDQGLKEVAKMEYLEGLDLWRNKITDKGLHEIAKMNNLRRLNVCLTDVTRDGIDSLQKSIPDCQIWWDGHPHFVTFNQFPRIMGSNEDNPRTIILAANRLRQSDKESVIAALREYCRFTKDELRSEKKYCQTRVRSILPTLFSPIENRLTTQSRFGPMGTTQRWPFSPITIQDDIPFRTNALTAKAGPPATDCNYLIEKAAQDYKFIKAPLKPTDDPFDALAKVQKKLTGKINEDFLEQQVLKMLPGQKRTANGVRWDPEKQKYTAIE